MWGSAFPSNASVEGMADAERRSYQGLSHLIASGRDDSSVRSDVDPMASAVLHGLMRGVAALFLADGDAADMQAVRRACRDWITSALAATRH